MAGYEPQICQRFLPCIEVAPAFFNCSIFLKSVVYFWNIINQWFPLLAPSFLIYDVFLYQTKLNLKTAFVREKKKNTMIREMSWCKAPQGS